MAIYLEIKHPVEGSTDGTGMLLADVIAHYVTDDGTDSVIPGRHKTVPVPVDQVMPVLDADDPLQALNDLVVKLASTDPMLNPETLQGVVDANLAAANVSGQINELLLNAEDTNVVLTPPSPVVIAK